MKPCGSSANSRNVAMSPLSLARLMAAVSFAFSLSASDGERGWGEAGLLRFLVRETVGMIQLLLPQPAQVRFLVGAQLLLPRDRRRRLRLILLAGQIASQAEPKSDRSIELFQIRFA